MSLSLSWHQTGVSKIDFNCEKTLSHPSSRFLRAEQILGLARQASGWVESSARACVMLGTTSFEKPTGLDLEGQGRICNCPL